MSRRDEKQKTSEHTQCRHNNILVRRQTSPFYPHQIKSYIKTKTEKKKNI